MRIPHRAPLPPQYHQFVLQGMRKASTEAGADVDKFLRLFDSCVARAVREKPEMVVHEFRR